MNFRTNSNGYTNDRLILKEVTTEEDIREYSKMSLDLALHHKNELGLGVNSSELGFYIYNTRTSIETKFRTFYLIKIESGLTVGMISIRKPDEKNKTLHISELYVKPFMRGNSVASDVISRLKDDYNNCRMSLRVVRANRPALRTYTKNGFVHIPNESDNDMSINLYYIGRRA